MGFNLNKEQVRAIRHVNGPLLVVAGAGTGKTTVIIERIKYLITSGKAKPEEILALTFTEKAALEIEKRVDEVMPLSYGDVWITTFHSFCDSILRESGLHSGLSSNFKLMTKEKSIDLFKKNLFNFSLKYFRPIGNPNKFIDSILTHFSRLQDEVITPEDYLKWIDKKIKTNKDKSEENLLELNKWRELANVYKEYDRLKLNEAKFDFGDLIIKTIELFKNRPNILKIYQEKFKYILVDEFQDTNFAQNELTNLIARKYNNISVIGDDNQSIYRFRGAAVSNILKFKENYKTAKTITLNKNYRSTQNILDASYKLIKHNDPDTLEARLGISKKLHSVKSLKSVDIKNIQTQTGTEEAEEVVKEIVKLVSHNLSRYNYSDITILVRANNHADIFLREFERQGIPHQFLGPSSLFQKEEIVDLISYLKSLYDVEDTESFYRLLSSENLSISHDKLLILLNKSKRESKSLYEVFAENNLNKKFISLFNKHLIKMKNKSCGEILYEYLNEMGIYKRIIENEDDVKAKNISRFFERIKTFENENPNAKLREVVDYINLLKEVGESPEVVNNDWQEENKVNILTVHSSKGLEFPVVFLVNLVSDRFPSRNRSEDLPIPEELIKEELPKGDYHLQEERRLFYVGMTRAKERLYLTSARYYNDGKREKKISPFVSEALGEVVESSKHKVVSLKQKLKTQKKTILHTTSNILPQKIEYLSVSQIETFETCPMHYKLKYVYNLPTSKTASISFGITIHETLKKLYEVVKEKGDIKEKELLKIYKNNFIEEGFENKKHKEEFFKKGEQYLVGFLKNGFNKHIIPDKLEEKFTIKLSKDLKIGGTIDRIDKLGKNRFEIIDYKTGANIPSQKEVDKNMQLSVYSLAVSQMYKVNPEDIKLSLYYLDTQEKITTRKTKKDLENVKKEILEIKNEIENSDFKCNNSYFCQKGCEFSMFCKKEN